MIHFSKSTKMMGAGIALSMCWFVFEACDCDESKEDQYPGFWVACIGNKPTLMTYNGDTATIVSSDPAGNFNPAQYDCTTPNSPPQPKSSSPAFPSSGPGGPGGANKPHATSPGAAFLPQPLRHLPFMPPVPLLSAPTCDSTFPDVFQTVHTNSLVTRISTCPFQIKATIPVVSRPLQIEFTKDGATALVTSFDNAVNFIDVASNRVTFTLKTADSINPDGIAISPDGSRAYVTSFNPDNSVVIVIDMASRTIIATIPTITYPQGVALTPDGSQLWVTGPLGNAVDVIDTQTNTRVTGRGIAQSTGVAFNATGTRAYLTSAPNSVVVLDTATFQVLKTYTVGIGPTDISMGPADQFLVVNNGGDGSITVIDLVKDKVSTLAVGGVPSGISFVH
jgi:YVTN family beta-propeller protein